MPPPATTSHILSYKKYAYAQILRWSHLGKNFRFVSDVFLKLIHQQNFNVKTKLATFVREISSKSSYFYGLVIGSWLFLTYFKQYFDTIIMMVVPSCLKEMNTSTLAKKSLKYVFEVNYGDCSNWRHMTPSFYLTSLFIWRPLDVIKSRWIKLIYLVLRTSHTSFIYHL